MRKVVWGLLLACVLVAQAGCKTKAEVGNECATSEDCRDGLTCGDDNTCQSPGTNQPSPPTTAKAEPKRNVANELDRLMDGLEPTEEERARARYKILKAREEEVARRLASAKNEDELEQLLAELAEARQAAKREAARFEPENKCGSGKKCGSPARCQCPPGDPLCACF